MSPALTVKGETDVEIAGRSFRLAYSFTAMAVYQQEREETFFEFGQRAAREGIPVADVPWLFWLALLEHHGDEFAGKAGEDAAVTMAKHYGVSETVLAIGAAMGGAFPAPKKGGAKSPAGPRSRAAASPGT